ncbi:TATA-binding related factor of subunit 20 of mediator complex-domain-containing protein [Syncephalis plumigaleata]|nr:TATA-binding related factor of subunit 20 of mediator complex-domain-containing protein [Syncephalis plumigaleata]
MGETIIVRWTNANGAQSLQLLRERLERAYQASMLGRWGVQCRVYHATGGVITSAGNELNVGTPVGTPSLVTSGATTATAAASTSAVSASVTSSIIANTTTSNTTTTTPNTPNITTTTTTNAPASNPTTAAGTPVVGTPNPTPVATSTTNTAPVLLYIVQSTAWPNQVHAVMSGRVVVSAGRELEAILVKLRALWTLRQTAVIEGTTYAMGDLLLRAGSITVGQAHRGLIIELEYMASRTPGRCQPALKALLQELLPSNAVWHTISSEELIGTSTTETGDTTVIADTYDTRSPPIIQWEALGLSSTLCSSAHTAYQCARLLQQDRLL